MNTQRKLLIGILSILFILYAEDLALSKEIKSDPKEQHETKMSVLTQEQIIAEAQRSVDRSLTALSYTIIAIGVLVSLFTLIILVLGGVFGFLGFKTYSSLKKDIERAEDIAGKSETKYKEIKDTLHKVKPIVDKIARYEKDINDIKEKYEDEFRSLSISEKPSEQTQEKLDELTMKSEFLEGVGAELDPEDYFRRGLDYDYKGKYEKAKEAFEKAVELDPDHAHAWGNIGVTLCKLRKYEEAIKYCDKAVELNPDHAGAWFNRACAYSLKGDKGKSLENLRKTIELDPEYKEKAKNDEDLKDLWNDEDFKKIVE